jgi:hypothetical protein
MNGIWMQRLRTIFIRSPDRCIWRQRGRIFTLLLLIGTLQSVGACSVLDAEQHYRGGFTNKFADERLAKADSKSMRVLRATILLGILSQAATANVQGQDNVTAALNQMRATSYDIGVAYQVASTSTDVAPSCKVTTLLGDCYDASFDLHMNLVVDDLIRTAGMSLPTTDLKRLVSAVETGNYVTVLESLFTGLVQIIDTTRIGLAGYRDLVDANGAAALRATTNPPPDSFKNVYKKGEGSFAAYAPALDAYLATDRPGLLKASETDFVPWFRLIKFNCMRASWNKLYTTVGPANLPTLSKGMSADQLKNLSSCDLPADGFATGEADYPAGF